MDSIRSLDPQLKKLALGLLALGLMSIPFGLAGLSNLILLALLLVAIISLRKEDWRYSIKHKLTLASMAFFALYALSLLYSEDLQSGLENLETKFSFLSAPLILIALGRHFDRSDRNLLSWAFILGCLLSLGAALTYATYRAWEAEAWFYVRENGVQEHYFFLYETFAEPFMHPGYLSTHYGLAILLLVFRWRNKESAALLSAPLIAFLGIGLFLLQGRINILALALVLGVLILIWLLQAKQFRLLLGSLGLVLIVIVSFLSFAPQAIKTRYLAFPNFDYDISGSDFNSATYRLAEWKCARAAWEDRFWLGHGIGDGEQELFNSYRELGFKEGLERRYNAHNQYLETPLSVGLIGLFSLLILLSFYASNAWHNQQAAILAALIFFIICMLTESMFERAWGVVLFNVFFPTFLSQTQKSA